MVFISHLDLMSLFRRSIRRADLPFVLTGGFSPRVKISMPEALKLGRESEEEVLGFKLDKELDTAFIMKKLNDELPEGIRLFEVKRSGK